MPAADTTSVTRREQAKDEIVLDLLDIVAKDAAVTQRSVANELGIAVGLANAYLKRCIRKGLIRVSQVPPRRYGYYLTPQGFAEKSRLTASYLSHSFAFFRRARSECATLFDLASTRGHSRLALIGNGDLAEIASLVAREFSVDVVGVISTSERTLKTEINALGDIDAVMVTALEDPLQSYLAAVEIFGSNRVYAPALLHIGELEQEPQS